MVVAVWATLDESPGYAALLDRALGVDVAASVGVPFALGDPDELQRLCGRAGLDAAVVRHAGRARFASVREWITTEVRAWTLSDAVDDAALEHLVRRAEGELQGFTEPGGRVSFPVTALLAAATVPGRRQPVPPRTVDDGRPEA